MPREKKVCILKNHDDMAPTPADIGFTLAPLALGVVAPAFLMKKDRVPCGSKPSLQPPSWTFKVVWPVLYVLLGIFGALTWRASRGSWKDTEMVAWIALTTALLLWWPVFTYWCQPFFAFATIVLITLISYLLFNLAPSWQRRALIAPLCAWLTFASMLAFQSWGAPPPRPPLGA
jgi:translocator protein